MLLVNGVTKKYGKTLAVDDLGFSVGDGSVAVLLGPNGAGKSTIIKCIAGLLRYSGSIELNGFDNRSTDAKRILGYVPEMPSVYELLTVDEHIEFIARAYSMSDWQARADALIDRFELYDKRKKLGRELSKGMQQKLSIICAVLPQPRVLVLDEPIVGLDPHAIKELRTLIGEMKADGASMLISTHMIESVEDYWDTAHIMMSGSIRATRHIGDEHEKSLEDQFFEITEGSSEIS